LRLRLGPILHCFIVGTVRLKIRRKKKEMAMIQLAARKNLIQMSSDVIHYNSNCHSGLSRHLPTTCLDYFVFPEMKNNVFKNRPDTIPELMQVITDNSNLLMSRLCEGHLKT
jgi:hypothetical protein